MTDELKHHVLFLGDEASPLVEWLRGCGIHVTTTMAKLDAGRLSRDGVTFLVSYGYRHILDRTILEMFPDSAINLHISLLPWNRGADPNLWSFIDGTPKGVTIHYLDEGVDTGDIIAQAEVSLDAGHTLASSYRVLHERIQQLFCEHWPAIAAGTCDRRAQPAGGTVHRVRDKASIEHLLTKGWDTPVCELEPGRVG